MKVALKSNELDLSVLIQCRNEGANLYRLLPVLKHVLASLGVEWEILIVDEGSTDGTDRVAKGQENVRYFHQDEPGLGAGMLLGIGEARGAYVLTMGADMSHPAEFIRELWDQRESADVLIASRYMKGGRTDHPWLRRVLSRTLNRFFASGLSIDGKDLTSAFRLYRKGVFDGMNLEFMNYVILLEIRLQASGRGMIVKELPFHYKPQGSGSPIARVLRFGLDYFRLFYRVWRMRNSIEFPDYDWRAYDSRIWLQRYWQRTRHEIVLRFTPPFVSTCDVGCGSSRILADLPHAVAVDMRHDKLAFMRKTNRLLAQGDGMRLPFVDDSFECVICSQVIEHIPEENGRLIDELTRILKPGGVLVLGTPDYDRWEWCVLEWIYGKVVPGAYADEHVTHYTYKTLKEALETRGYTDLDHDYVGRGELIFRGTKSGGE